jgi:hypothetical protein
MPRTLKMCSTFLSLTMLIVMVVDGPIQAQVAGIWTETTEEDFATGLGVDTVNVDIRTSPGDIVLAPANENFAFGKLATDDDDRNDNRPENVVDGDIATYWSSQTPHCLGVSLIIDLQAQRLIERVNILGGTINPQLFRIRGYRISVSPDNSNWTLVAENSENLDADVFETIEPVITRYVRVTISVINEVNWVVIGDIEVFGAGYASRGSYYSEVKDFGVLTNFGQASWIEQLPDADMDITMQFRSDSVEVNNDGGILEDTLALANGGIIAGSEVVTDESETILYNRGIDYEIDYAQGLLWRLETTSIDSAALIMIDYRLWSSWSGEYSDAGGSLFQITEPRRYLQYRANLFTSTTNTPILEEINIAYDTTPVAQKSLGAIIPNEIPIMQESRLTYLIQLTFGSEDLGIDTVIVSTPSPGRVSAVRWNQEPLAESQYQNLTDNHSLKLGFPETLVADSTADLEIEFLTTLFFSENDYPSLIISRNSADNPQTVEQAESTWTVTTVGIPVGTLVSVEAKPNPFSPNGDGLFDETVISYFVAKIAYPQPLSIKIYDLNGDRIRILRDQNDPAFFYEIAWDGRDDDGELVPPGLYIYQVRLKADQGEEVVTRTITVQY